MRLTEKLIDTYRIGFDEEMQGINKLGQLEDIEDRLGIDLITLFNAYFNGFYIKGGFVRGGEYYLELCLETKSFRLKATDDKYYFEDYGKTWALIKEELE